jgi:hypothetical protein
MDGGGKLLAMSGGRRGTKVGKKKLPKLEAGAAPSGPIPPQPRQACAYSPKSAHYQAVARCENRRSQGSCPLGPMFKLRSSNLGIPMEAGFSTPGATDALDLASRPSSHRIEWSRLPAVVDGPPSGHLHVQCTSRPSETTP